jgi:hypothetical protein
MFDAVTLREKLKAGVLQVTFTKVNGDLRVMTCTTNPNLIPEAMRPVGKVAASEEASSRTIRVYDLEAEGWRSFVVENVTETIEHETKS